MKAMSGIELECTSFKLSSLGLIFHELQKFWKCFFKISISSSNSVQSMLVSEPSFLSHCSFKTDPQAAARYRPAASLEPVTQVAGECVCVEFHLRDWQTLMLVCTASYVWVAEVCAHMELHAWAHSPDPCMESSPLLSPAGPPRNSWQMVLVILIKYCVMQEINYFHVMSVIGYPWAEMRSASNSDLLLQFTLQWNQCNSLTKLKKRSHISQNFHRTEKHLMVINVGYSAYSSFFHKICNHDDNSSVLLPNHSPKIFKCWL